MKTFAEYIGETSSHGTGTQTHDITGIQRIFPELLDKKKKANLSWKQRRQHRRQKEKAGVTSITRKTGEVVVNETKNYTVMNQFGGVKYKNVSKARQIAGIRVTDIKVPTHRNNLEKPALHLSKRDIDASKGLTRSLRSFKDFSSKAVKNVVNNPVKKISNTIGNAIKKSGQFTKKVGTTIYSSPRPSSPKQSVVKKAKITSPNLEKPEPIIHQNMTIGANQVSPTTPIVSNPTPKPIKKIQPSQIIHPSRSI